MNFIYFVISSSILILLVSVFRKMFSRKLSPVVIYALWLIPTLRLLLPFGLVEIPEGSGALVDRHILAYGNVDNDRKGQLVLKLTPKSGEAQKKYTKLAVEFYWDGVALKESELPDIMTQDEESRMSASALIEIPLPDGIPQKLWSADEDTYGKVREKYEVEAGDDFVLAAAYLTSTAEDGQRAYVSSRLEKFSYGQLPEELKDMSIAGPYPEGIVH